MCPASPAPSNRRRDLPAPSAREHVLWSFSHLGQCRGFPWHRLAHLKATPAVIRHGESPEELGEFRKEGEEWSGWSGGVLRRFSSDSVTPAPALGEVQNGPGFGRRVFRALVFHARRWARNARACNNGGARRPFFRCAVCVWFPQPGSARLEQQAAPVTGKERQPPAAGGAGRRLDATPCPVQRGPNRRGTCTTRTPKNR